MTSKKALYVFSTLSADNEYGVYAKGGADIPSKTATVVIKGGANVADKRLVTPLGVATPVTPEQLEILRQDVTFQHHEKNGYITVSEHKADADTVAADMEGRSPDAPLVPLDFQQGEPDVTTNKPADAVPAPRGGRGTRNR